MKNSWSFESGFWRSQFRDYFLKVDQSTEISVEIQILVQDISTSFGNTERMLLRAYKPIVFIFMLIFL